MNFGQFGLHFCWAVFRVGYWICGLNFMCFVFQRPAFSFYCSLHFKFQDVFLDVFATYILAHMQRIKYKKSLLFITPLYR